MENLISYLIIAGAVLIVILILYLILRNPYHYPYKDICIDISGRRKVKMLDEIETYILNRGIDGFTEYYEDVEDWKDQKYTKAEKSLLKFLRLKQLDKVVDDDALFTFNLFRKQTRYKQQNYVKTPYTVKQTTDSFSCNYEYVVDRYRALEKIDFETTTSKYKLKKQRRMMTQELRERIKLRDNYTCQQCGKYMPDGVGLHIDHIIPVSRGGKTVESNLQVLCSVCNGSKSNRVQIKKG